MKLQSGENGRIGSEVVRNCKEFQSVSREDFKRQINQRKVDDILDDFSREKGGQSYTFDKEQVKKRWQEFKDEYGERISSYISSSSSQKPNFKENLKS